MTKSTAERLRTMNASRSNQGFVTCASFFPPQTRIYHLYSHHTRSRRGVHRQIREWPSLPHRQQIILSASQRRLRGRLDANTVELQQREARTATRKQSQQARETNRKQGWRTTREQHRIQRTREAHFGAWWNCQKAIKPSVHARATCDQTRWRSRQAKDLGRIDSSWIRRDESMDFSL